MPIRIGKHNGIEREGERERGKERQEEGRRSTCKLEPSHVYIFVSPDPDEKPREGDSCRREEVEAKQ
jgi:hypothetical protein